MNQRQYILYQLCCIRDQNPQEAVTSDELYTDMPDDIKTNLFSAGQIAVNKTLDALRRLGMVVNGTSVYKEHKTKLTWKIHPDYSAATTDPQPETEMNSNLPAPAPEPESEPEPELQNPIDSAPTQFIALNLNDQLEASLAQLIQQLLRYRQQEAKPQLNDPETKRTILAVLTESQLVNPEYKRHLSELLLYVDQLPGSSQRSSD